MQCGMLGNEVLFVGKFSNEKNGVCKPFAGDCECVVIMLIEKYSEWHFLVLVKWSGIAYAERLKKSPIP